MNPDYLSRTLWRGALGIAAELTMIVFFLAAGFIICIFWWKVL